MKYKFLSLMILFWPALISGDGQDLPGYHLRPGGQQTKAAAAVTGTLPQNIDYYNWLSNDWAADKSVTITYTNYGLPLTLVTDYVEGNDQKMSYTYDVHHNPVQVLIQELENDVWTDKIRTIMEYNSHGLTTMRKQERYLGGQWFLDYMYKFEFEMDGSRIIKMTTSEYDRNSESFQYVNRTTYTYDEKGWVGMTYTEVFTDGIWLNSQRTYYYWKSEDKEDYVIIESWVETSWMKLYKYVYTYGDYDSYHYILYLYNEQTEEFDNPYMRGTLTNDNHYNQVLFTQEIWIETDWSMSYGFIYDITYEGDNMVQRITQMYFTVTDKYVNSTKEVFRNYINLGMDDPVHLSLQLDCYPNPASGQVTLDYSAIGSLSWSIELIDLNGRTLMTSRPELPAGRITWNLSGVGAGFYLVRMTDQLGRTIIRNLVKQ